MKRSKVFRRAGLVFASGLLLSGWGLSGCSDDDNEVTCIPHQEECNGLDDDCDGLTDEGGSEGHLRKSCQSACGTGYQTCVDGVWEECDAPQPQQEVCDGVDNDCNGLTDENCECKVGETRPCGTNVGECREGIEHCVDGHWSGQCEGGVQPADNDGEDTRLCNGKDDDCDGATDEDCQCTPNQTQPCGTDVGVCKKGTQTCEAGGTWGECVGAVEPTDETCDGTDNDCDGEIDEDLNRFDLDSYEMNEDCQPGIFTDLTSAEAVNEGDGPSEWTAVLYPADDVDWYKIHVEEATHIIWCGTDFGKPQCFWSEFKLTLPEGLTPDDVIVSVIADTDGQCGGDQQPFLSNENPDEEWAQVGSNWTWTLYLTWEGSCGGDDSWDFFVKVEYADPAHVQPACTEYTFSMEMGFFDQCETGCDDPNCP